jgi:YVTN family beta-propeller protein
MVNDDKVYQIIYLAKADKYEYYLPIIQNMIESLKLIDFLPYENPLTLELRVQYPSNWKLEEYYSGVTFSSPPESENDSFQENLLLSVYPAENKTPEDILIKDEAHFEDFQIIKPINTTIALANNPAHMIVFSFTENGVEYKAMKVITVKDNKVYDIIYFAEPEKFDTYLPTIQKMIESFEILDFIPYENLNDRVKIDHPSYWKIIEEDENNESKVTFSSPPESEYDSFQENLLLSVSPAENKTLDDIVNRSINDYEQSLVNFNVTQVNITLVNTTSVNSTIQAIKVEYTYGDSQQNNFKVMQVWTIKDDKEYNIKYIAKVNKYSYYLPIIQKVVNSFEIIELPLIERVDFIPYENRVKYGVKINYSTNWEIIEEDENNVRFSSLPESEYDSFQENLLLSVYPTEKEKYSRLYDLISEEINSYRQKYPDTKNIESNATTISNISAIVISLTITDINIQSKIKILEYITLKEDKVYYITYFAEPEKYYEYLPIIQKMVKSFQIATTIKQDYSSISKIINNSDQAPLIGKTLNEDQLGQRGLEADGLPVANNPFAIAFNPNTHTIYVSNTRSNTVSVIDGIRHTILANVSVGKLPYSLAVDLFANTIYVANTRSNTVSVIDGVTNSVVDTIPVGSRPVDIAVNSATDRVYVANHDSNTISVIEGSTNNVISNITLTKDISQTPFSGMSIAINVYTNKIYVANENSDRVYVIDGRTNIIVDTLEFNGPISVAVNPNINRAYVVENDTRQVSVIDGETNTVLQGINVGKSPKFIAVNLKTNKIYVTDNLNNTVSVIDGNNTSSKLETINVGRSPTGLAVDPDTNTIYVANTRSNTISIVNGTTKNLVAGVTFNINPPNSGEIHCKGYSIQDNDYIKYDIGTQLTCEAKANNIFPPAKFSFWSVLPPLLFDSWSSDFSSNSNNNNPIITFDVSRYGTMKATFKELIPSRYMEEITVATVGSVSAAIIIRTIVEKKKRIRGKAIKRKTHNKLP